jgi:hypothetical protein
MEMNAIMQALVKDLAEQMRPMVVVMIDDWMNDSLSEKLAQLNARPAGDVDLTDLAQHLTGGQLEVMARHINLADLAAELGDNFADDIAEHISLSDLASEINLESLSNELDLEDSIKSFFSDNQATISF